MRKIIITLNFILIMAVGFSQNYDWKGIHDSIRTFPRLAEQQALQILTQAKKQQDCPAQTRSIILIISSYQQYKEAPFVDAIEFLKKQKLEGQQCKAMKDALLGYMYYAYYSRNKWKILDRTNMDSTESSDICTWTTKNFAQTCQYYFSSALNNAQLLKEIPAKDYGLLFKPGTAPSALTPTAFDLVTEWILKFYTNYNIGLTQPKDHFSLDDPRFFLPPAQFIKIEIKTTDTLSFQYNILKIFQLREKTHLNDTNKEALVNDYLDRLQYLYNNYQGRDKDMLYLLALDKTELLYPKVQRTSLAFFLKANYYYQHADANDSLKKDYLIKALAIAQKLISSYDNNEITKEAISHARELKQQIKEPQLSIDIESPLAPKSNFPIQIKYKNITTTYIAVYQINQNIYYNNDESHDKLLKKILKSRQIAKQTVKLRDPKDYFPHSAEAILKGLPAGKYAIVISTDPAFILSNKNLLSYALLNVSSINLSTQVSNKTVKVFALDRLTGQPLKGLNITEIQYTRWHRQKKRYELKTNDKGIVEVQVKGLRDWTEFTFIAHKGNSEIRINVSGTESYISKFNKETKAVVFLDRKIYRPGQTVYFKGLIYQTDHREFFEALRNYEINITVYDINYTQVGEISTKTDDFGGFSGQFIVPQSRATGSWTIRVNNLVSERFNVEQYKRPQFYVKFDTIKDAVIAGQRVTITGHALNYNNTPVANAQVEYLVKKMAVSFWQWWIQPNEQVIMSGKTKTDANGQFTIDIQTSKTIEKDKMIKYLVNAKVTDINGETHASNTSLRVADQSVFVKINFHKWQNITHKNYFSITVANIQNKEMPELIAQYKIVKLTPPASHPFISRLWQKPDQQIYSQQQWNKLLPIYEYDNESDPNTWQKGETVQKGQLQSGQKINIKFPAQGIYKAVVTLTDPKTGKPVKQEQLINVFNTKAKTPYAPMPFYAHSIKNKYKPGDIVKILVGSGWGNAHIFYQIICNGKIYNEKWIKLSGAQKIISVPVTQEMIGNFAINIIAYINNRDYSKEMVINVPFPSKKLNITVSRLKSKVSPGQKVKFKVKITDTNEKPVIANILASAYDASLDAFIKNKWYFHLYRQNNSFYPISTQSSEVIYSWNHLVYQEPISVVEFTYPEFDWFLISFYPQYRSYGFEKSLRQEAPVTTLSLDTKNTYVIKEAETNEANKNEGNTDFADIKIRENLKETAFFYPDIKTDSQGIAWIEFQMPDDLTKWHLQIFANDTAIDYAITSQDIETAKPLMIFPNVPRFVRQGDKLSLSAKIVNNSEQNQQVKVKLVIKNAVTEQDLSNDLIQDELIKTISLRPERVANVSWQINIPADLLDPLEVTVLAKNDKYSDAQQNIIPVLSNRVLVTETMPMPVGPKGKQTFTFDKLINHNSSTIKSYRYELEFNSNPVWYALTALPYIMQYPYECNEQIFSRFYGNTMASYILNSDPQIKRVFQIWKQKQAQELKSPLEQKQQLKQIALEETPWLLDARKEQENTARLSLLFDLNKMAYEKQQTLNKLLNRQNSDGGWPWFQGMESSWFVTQHILIGFARLNQRKIIDYKQGHLKQALFNAISYTDKQANQYYTNLKKWYKPQELKKNHLSAIIVHYLYMRSLYPQISPLSQTDFKYFYSQLKKYWSSLNLYLQAIAAITFDNFNDKTLAKQVLSSLKDRAIEDKEMGVYWAANKPGWFWYQAPIETQAMLIEAFNQITHDTAFVEKMKIWLLKNKQTNSWETTKATTEAIYALMFTGYNWLSENKPVRITIAGHTYPDAQTRQDAGTGYFSKVWTDGQIQPSLGKITVKNPNHHPTWGAAYWQYFEDIDKVQAADAGVSVQRKYFLVKRDDQGEHLVPITASAPIHVGDEIVVRIILSISRPMEFLHLKDLRPASFEPKEQLSGYRWKSGIGYYQSIHDASANFFIDHLNKGRYVFEYRVYATMAGQFSAGFATFQCMYAPEFSSHSNGMEITVKP